MMRKIMARLSVLLLLAGVYGCESAVDCLDNDGPEFVNGITENPVLNEVYAQRLQVEINNEPRDDNFRYNFQFTGELPEGISTVANGRTYILDGTATELGTFRFTVYVEVDDNLDPAQSGLCYYNTSRSYEITVQEM